MVYDLFCLHIVSFEVTQISIYNNDTEHLQGLIAPFSVYVDDIDQICKNWFKFFHDETMRESNIQRFSKEANAFS